MDFRTIVKKEDFIPVFIKTTEKYYADVLKQNIKISPVYIKESKCLYINFIPSFIASFPVTNGMKELLYSEYNVRGNKLKFLAGKALVLFTLTTQGLFAWKKLWIETKEGFDEQFYCLPCNRTNRYFDFRSDSVDCVTKVGYDTGLMENQLSFRQKYCYSFVPKVLDRGDYWYRERIMHGNSLARVVDQTKYKNARNEAIRCLGQLVKDTKEVYSSNTYIKMIDAQLDGILKKMEQDIPAAIEESARQVILSLKSKLFEYPFEIPVSMSHGDFQEGNIWVNLDDSVTIYDWETNGLRSIWYDLVTLQMNLRNTIGSELLREFILNSDDYLLFDIKTQYSSIERENILRIITIEDFMFQLTEYSQRLFDRNEEGLKNIIERYQRILGEIDGNAKE